MFFLAIPFLEEFCRSLCVAIVSAVAECLNIILKSNKIYMVLYRKHLLYNKLKSFYLNIFVKVYFYVISHQENLSTTFIIL